MPGPNVATKYVGFLCRNWRRILTVAVPVALCPILFNAGKESRCLYGILLMVIYWAFELLPLSVTALLPVFIFPVLGVLTTSQTTAPYMKDIVMMFLAGMILAIAVDYSNLHYRIALQTLLLLGTSISWVLFGLMIVTAFLSMWLSNTVTALMVLPIFDALTLEICRHISELEYDGRHPVFSQWVPEARDSCKREFMSRATPSVEIHATSTTNPLRASTTIERSLTRENVQLRQAMLLGMAYATTIGGTGSLVGTPTNIVLYGLVQTRYPAADRLSFATWMIYNVPPVLARVVLTWFYVYYILVPKCYHGHRADEFVVRYTIRRQYNDLGNISFHEIMVLVIFAATVLLWFFRHPHIMQGWSCYFALGRAIGDATPSMLSVLLLALIPAKPFQCFSGPPLLEWSAIQRKLPWGIILLIGGSFSIVTASDASGLAAKVASYLVSLDFMPDALLVATMTSFTAIVTEFISNTAAAGIILPVSSDLAHSLKIHPFYMMIPIANAASFSFMLPVGTPPNALIYHHGRMSTPYMARAGFVVNVGCILIELLFINTLGVWVFDLDEFPSWAEEINATSTMGHAK
ncbi:Na(+)/citrate cotransporter-like [Ornithodoros turicata]|uniref:Na(+)/citrate cotransporter-like n=1 Tax=Ornithodoros turicata TaxID=34597 RepID=UPI003138B6B4